MKNFRKVIFWMHLISGVLAGLFIFVMCVTGALIAFEPNILSFAESDQKYIVPPAENMRKMPVNELIAKFLETNSDAKPSSVTVQNEPNAAVMLSIGREGKYYINPYTAEVTGSGAEEWQEFFEFFEGIHRWLGLSDAGRTIGKNLNDAANFLFLFLALSGLYIWFPRRLSWQHFRPVVWFRRDLKGKSRDFNWHNTIGFWSSLVLIILTATAVVMSYQWANNLVYTLTASELPQQQKQQGAPTETAEQTFNLPGNFDEVWRKAESQTEWKSISLRLPINNESAAFTIDEGKFWNKKGRSTLTLDFKTGEVIKWESYGDQSAGRQLRSWVRFTHTGETGGFIGQFMAFLACIGGAFLVWTGISLAIRRFYGWREK